MQAPEPHAKAALLTEAGTAAGAAEIFESEEQMEQALNTAIQSESATEDGNESVAAAARSRANVEPVAAAV